MIVFTAVLVALGGLLYCLAVRGKDVLPPESASPTEALEEKKTSIFENLRDLQFEHRVGKLSDEDYQRSKLDLQRELAAVMARIDGLPDKDALPHPAPAPPAGVICPKCGAHLPQPMKFCGECGAAMSGGTR